MINPEVCGRPFMFVIYRKPVILSYQIIRLQFSFLVTVLYKVKSDDQTHIYSCYFDTKLYLKVYVPVAMARHLNIYL